MVAAWVSRVVSLRVNACMRLVKSSFSFLMRSSSFAVATPCRPTSVVADGAPPSACVMVQSPPNPTAGDPAADALVGRGPSDTPAPLAIGVCLSTMKTLWTEPIFCGSVSLPLTTFNYCTRF